MMLSKKTVFAAMVLTLGLLLGGVPAGHTPVASAAEPIVWDFLDLDAAGHPVVIVLNEWSDEVFARTNGQLKINIRVGGELPFATNEYLTATSQGSVQMAGCMSSSVGADLPLGGIASLPYIATDFPKMAQMMEVLDPFLNKELADYNLMNLMTIAYPTQEVFGRGKTPAGYKEMKGMKVRTSGSEMSKFWGSLGLVPTAIDASEVISSLSKNVINGVVTAVLTVDRSKWYESLDWAYINQSQLLPTFCVVNLDAFNALPADVQKVLVDVSDKYKLAFGERMAEFTAESYKSLEANGVEIVYATEADLAEMKAVAATQWDEYAGRIGDQAKEALAAIKSSMKL